LLDVGRDMRFWQDFVLFIEYWPFAAFIISFV
jgi:hypothetical protein